MGENLKMKKVQLVFEFGGFCGILFLEVLSAWLPSLIIKNPVFYLLEAAFLVITIIGTAMKYSDR